jgi:hypothetical protein
MRAQKVNFAASSSHADRDLIHFSGIQILICACKYDVLKTRDLAVQTAVSKGLRCVAHAHGAHLCYLGTSGSGTQAATEVREEVEDMQKKLRTILTHVVFTGFDKKACVLLPCLVLATSAAAVGLGSSPTRRACLTSA